MNKRRVKGSNQSTQKEKTKSLIDSKNLERNILNELSSEFNNQKVFIKLNVEIDKNWHTNENSIKKYLDLKGN